MGWWSRLFGRRAAAAAASRALPAAAEPEPAPVTPPEPEDDHEISPARLDQALQRLRDEIPAPDEGPQV